MNATGSIFLDFTLPNATTWFIFSLLLVVAIFFKFSRFLSVRNLDILTLFLLVPGLLILQEAHSQEAILTAGRVAWAAQVSTASAVGGNSMAGAMLAGGDPVLPRVTRTLWYGYLWLFGGSAYLLVRCLIDLALVRRPALRPNLNASGLAWLGGALFACLVAVAFRQPGQADEKVGKDSAALDQAQRRAEGLVNHQTGGTGDSHARFWVGRSLAMFCHLVVVAGLIFVGCRHFQDAQAGIAAATAYLLLPYTAFFVAQLHHVCAMAFMVWAVAAFRKPRLAGILLGLATGCVYYPVFVVPVWFSFYWRRGAGRFLGGFLLAAGLSLAITGTVLWFDGSLGRTWTSALTLADWQAWRIPTSEGFWLGRDGTGMHWAFRFPLFVAYLTFVLLTAFWPASKNLAQVIALSTAIIIGIQFWFADQGGVYVLWYLPFLLLLVFRPNLADRIPPVPSTTSSWIARSARAIAAAARKMFSPPQPVARVS